MHESQATDPGDARLYHLVIDATAFDDESIVVREVPLDSAAAWLQRRAADGLVISAKVWTWQHAISPK